MTESGPGGGGAALETSLLFDVYALNQAVTRLLEDAMRDGPLTPGEYAVYSAILELEAASPTALAARLGMRLTTFIDKLRLLEGRGHARRLAHPSDGRSYRVVLTVEGIAAHRAANHAFEVADATFAHAFGDGLPAAQSGLAAARLAADRARVLLEARVAPPLSGAVSAARTDPAPSS